MINFENRRVLILAPHTDDAELGMGGTIARMQREGAVITVIAFSSADESLPPGFEKGTTRAEFSESMRLYQVDGFDVLNFKVREFPRDRQALLEELIKIRKDVAPDIIFCPASEDVHQDHKTVYQETLRAFRLCSILGYELPWNCFNLRANFFIHINEQDFQKKLESIQLYKSQLAKESIYLNETFLTSQLQQNGARLGRNGLFEAFEVIRIIN